jgi:transketolase
MTISNTLQEKAINAIRFLSADAVEQANSGHPGLPMGTAAMAYTIWMKHMRFNPVNPDWSNRDRFILSGGHGSAMLYSLLYLTGFDLPLDEIKKFRQWGSLTPGHPEYGWTVGVETTTGPLGQGFANGVGMALAEAHLATVFNKPGYKVIDHYTYAIVTDGDLMEGVASEAASLAGHLKLGKLIYLYDDNRISIDGSTDISFTEDRAARFEAYGWHVQKVADGNDVAAIDTAIQAAKQDERPSLIVCRTHIGYGLPTRQDTSAAHGAPPGEEELNGAKEKLGWPIEPRFFIPDDVLAHFRSAVDRGTQQEEEWNATFTAYKAAFPETASQMESQLAGVLPAGWDKELPVFPADPKGAATRQSSGAVINALAGNLPALMGGSADLAPSNNTLIKGSPDFQHKTPEGRNLRFGVREHAMGAIINGMAYHKGLIPYGATFMVFTDYVRPAMRLAALSHLRTIWIMTHDSIFLGEDGPTHQPVEHLAAMRAIPNLNVIRPADANETAEAWKVAIESEATPTMLALSRQNVPTLNRDVYAPASGLRKGAYVLKDFGSGTPDIILIASGSEVGLITAAGDALAAEGVNVRLVSFPCWKLFSAQDDAYKESVLPKSVTKRLAVEAGVSLGWERWIGLEGDMISIERFGASAPAKVLAEKFNFTVDDVIARAKALLAD